MSQLPVENGSTCQGEMRREKRISTSLFLSGRGVPGVDQFKYVESEGLFSVSLPHCTSVHEAASLLQLSFIDMLNFRENNLVIVPYRWRRMKSWGGLMINAVNACVWFRPTTRPSETSSKRWKNQKACEYTIQHQTLVTLEQHDTTCNSIDLLVYKSWSLKYDLHT